MINFITDIQDNEPDLLEPVKNGVLKIYINNECLSDDKLINEVFLMKYS